MSSLFSRKPSTSTANGAVTPPPAPASISKAKPGDAHKILDDFRKAVNKGASFSLDHSTLAAVVDALRHADGIDDRKMLLEHIMMLLAKLPEGGLKTNVQNSTVQLLYNGMAHPQATFLGNQYAWRSADGSSNNINLPDLGKAGMPYSRSVQQNHPLPADSLPDAGLVFDTLLRREKFVKHPAGLSSMMFSFAALVIHSVFRTSHADVNINETSSYVDLSPLYGNNQEAQDKVRARDGKGLLLPDVFAEDRLLLLPPAVCVTLVLFNRNHNYIARKLLEINERGTYVNPADIPSDDPKRTAKLLVQEEELFQTARLINCGWFAGIVFSDYFSAILGLVREGSSWSLNPFVDMRKDDHSLFERGQGNVCSVEFNCLYRWHATTSQEDEKWVERLSKKLFPGKTPDTVTINDFRLMARKIQATTPDVSHWTFDDLTRQTDGTFKDDELANFLHNATENPAATFGARGTPHVMRLHEIMGIEQNRRWGVCSLNDFRKFLGLKTYSTFEEWNSRPEVYTTAQKLYGHIDNLELYVGLQAEDPKPVVPGAGLCPGYTISRGILIDAIALTRGDRFFNADFTPFNLTAWGFADCQRDADGAGFGSMLGRLLLRTLPENYTENSVYTWFPLMTPEAMQTILKNLGQADKYDFTRPEGQRPPRVISEYADIAQILQQTGAFLPPYVARASTVIRGEGFFLATGDAARAKQDRQSIISALVNTPEAAIDIAQSFYDETVRKIKGHSYAVVGGSTLNIDIVRDVLKFVPLQWSSKLAGISVKTKQNPHGVYSEQELFDKLADIYTFLFLEVDPASMMVTRERVRRSIDELLRHIKDNLGIGNRYSWAGIVDSISQMFATDAERVQRRSLLERIYAINPSPDHLANSLLAILLGSTVELSLVLTHVVNFFMDSDKVADLQTVAINLDVKNASELQGFAREALRLDPPFRGVLRVVEKDEEIANIPLQKGEQLFLDVAFASLDKRVFVTPEAIDPGRRSDLYLSEPTVVNALGEDLTSKIMTQVLRAIFSLKNVRRGPGISGRLSRFKDASQPIVRYSYIDNHSMRSPWPTSLVIQYDPEA
ncbi:hypothetical protein PLICRDRAFT_253826 [Plicaturopsis crispa FD-325 SS-3]|nr:hypothetical protein PLICRDRAFT_253826 [Plicaturopsis crispa FD-325 SS-3]